MGMSDTMLVDTDVLVDFLRGFEKATDFINKYSSKIILSSIVVAELYAGVKGTNELTVLDNFVSLFSRCPNNRRDCKSRWALQTGFWQVSRSWTRGCYLSRNSR